MGEEVTGRGDTRQPSILMSQWTTGSVSSSVSQNKLNRAEEDNVDVWLSIAHIHACTPNHAHICLTHTVTTKTNAEMPLIHNKVNLLIAYYSFFFTPSHRIYYLILTVLVPGGFLGLKQEVIQLQESCHAASGKECQFSCVLSTFLSKHTEDRDGASSTFLGRVASSPRRGTISSDVCYLPFLHMHMTGKERILCNFVNHMFY